MLETGLTYKAANGRTFRILTKKKVAASNGCNFIGEDVANGTITYFNHKGENAFTENYNLQIDKYHWIPVYEDGSLGATEFVNKDALLVMVGDRKVAGFLRMENENVGTIALVGKKTFNDFYS